MTLSFKTKKTNGEPTYFVEKIWAGFSLNDYLWFNENGCWSTECYKENFSVNYNWFSIFMKVNPKIHTIREDKPDRWKAGNKIHFVIGNRTKNRFQFAPVIPCISVQEVIIYYNNWGLNVVIDGNQLSPKEIAQFAINDGFDSFKQFENWFKSLIEKKGSFTGKIIHWTNLKY